MFEKEVSAGIAFLESKGYDLSKIDLEVLNMQQGFVDKGGCILCQMFGDFNSGATLLNIWFTDNNPAGNPDTLGFACEFGRFPELTAEWKRQLSATRKPVVINDSVVADLEKLVPEINYKAIENILP